MEEHQRSIEHKKTDEASSQKYTTAPTESANRRRRRRLETRTQYQKQPFLEMTATSSNKQASGTAPAALNVYKKVAIIRGEEDVLTYEDGDGNFKSVTDLHLAAVATVGRPNKMRKPHLKITKETKYLSKTQLPAFGAMTQFFA